MFSFSETQKEIDSRIVTVELNESQSDHQRITHCVRVGRARHVREQLLKPGFLEENQSKINIFHHIWPWACMGKHGHAWANL